MANFAWAYTGNISINGSILTIQAPNPVSQWTWIMATTTPFFGYDDTTFNANAIPVVSWITEFSCVNAQCPTNNTIPAGTWYVMVKYNTAGTYTEAPDVGTDFFVVDSGGFVSPSSDTSTHFISLLPTLGSTVATTTTVGAEVYANMTDFDSATGGRIHVQFTQDSAFACQNSGAVYDAIATCAGPYAPASPINIDFSTSTANRLISGNYNLSSEITFPGGGNWTGVFTIDQISKPWYFLGLFSSYNTLVSTTTHFTIGQASPMDLARQSIASSSEAFASSTRAGIGAILASTTASLVNACNPFNLGGGFSPGDCITLMIWPGDQALQDDLLIINHTPPWGYVFRVITLLNATTSSTTLPSISYTFASSSPMAVIGEIHFDPFGSLAGAGELINEFKSDRDDSATVWTIMMPIVNAFIYLVLAFMIIHDLTNIHWGESSKSRHDNTRD